MTAVKYELRDLRNYPVGKISPPNENEQNIKPEEVALEVAIVVSSKGERSLAVRFGLDPVSISETRSVTTGERIADVALALDQIVARVLELQTKESTYAAERGALAPNPVVPSVVKKKTGTR